MKIKLPGYDDFKCTADKCPITCCMQWKIAVDKETRKSWKATIYDGKKLDSFVTTKDGQDVIRLNEDKYCPFLNREKLCNLVLSYGTKALSSTCDAFPRQVHEFGDVTEYSLVSCCPAVIDIFNERKMIEFDCGNTIDKCLCIRNLIINIIKDEDISIATGLLMSFYILLDIYERFDGTDDAEFYEYEDKAFLDELKARVEEICNNAADTFTEDNAIWLDLVYNYRKEKLYTEFIEEISLLAEKYEKAPDDSIISGYGNAAGKYDRLLRNFLVAEFFTNLYVPESDLLGMVVKLQWISMEFVAIRHGIFLKTIKGRTKASYEEVREIIVVLSRMMGYDEEDIFAYMENSFESVVWEWGYMALILGK